MLCGTPVHADHRSCMVLAGEHGLLRRSRCIGHLHQNRFTRHVLSSIILLPAGAEVDHLKLLSLGRGGVDVATGQAGKFFLHRAGHHNFRTARMAVICLKFQQIGLQSIFIHFLADIFCRPAVLPLSGNPVGGIFGQPLDVRHRLLYIQCLKNLIK